LFLCFFICLAISLFGYWHSDSYSLLGSFVNSSNLQGELIKFARNSLPLACTLSATGCTTAHPSGCLCRVLWLCAARSSSLSIPIRRRRGDTPWSELIDDYLRLDAIECGIGTEMSKRFETTVCWPVPYLAMESWDPI
jgi:hypothetical protein